MTGLNIVLSPPFHPFLILSCFFLSASYWFLSRILFPPCSHIPSATVPGRFSVLRTALSFPKGTGRFIVWKGYKSYKGRLFQIPQFDHWAVFVSGPLLKDLQQASDDQLSFNDAAELALHTTYTHGKPLNNGSYHITVIKEQLEASLKNYMCEALYDETRDAFTYYLGDPESLTGNITSSQQLAKILDMALDWKNIKALKAVQGIVARINNRIFIGIPKCREVDYLDVVVKFAVHVIVISQIINLFPDVFKSIVGNLLSYYNPPLRRAEKHLLPIIEQRKQVLLSSNNWDDLPDDMLTWLMRYEGGPSFDTRGIIARFMNINLASIHTTSMVVCHILYELSVRPEDVSVLKEEIIEEICRNGRSSRAYNNMVKLDSYIKESMRFTGIGLLTGRRKALKPFTFSDGTQIPKNTFLYAASWAVHHDDEIYAKAMEFDGFRFSRSRELAPDGKPQALVTPRDDFLPFGIGRHICVRIF